MKNGPSGSAPGKGARVTVAGHICLDVIPHFTSASLLEPGTLNEVGPARFATGGAVANVGLALDRLGVDVRLVARLGDDPFGSILERLLRERAGEFHTGLQRASGESTSYSVVVSPPGTDRLFLHHPGCNDSFDPERVDRRLLDDSEVLYFGYPPAMRSAYQDGGRALAELLRDAREAGVLTVLDMAMPDPQAASGRVDWPEYLAGVLPHVDIFMPSLEEARYMLSGPGAGQARGEGGSWDSLEEMAGRLIDLGAAVTVIKLGENGVYLRSGVAGRVAEFVGEPAALWSGRTLWTPAFRVEVVGTTGAGDATVAGFIASLLARLNPEQSLATAAAVGACSVEAADANSGVRSWEYTRQRMSEDWQRRAEPGPGAGWQLDEASGSYRGPGDDA